MKEFNEGGTRTYDGPWREKWLAIGRANPWIKEALDDQYDFDTRLDVITECSSADTLFRFFQSGNWCLGAAFSLGEVCFINQVNAGDEWLTIRRGVAFESMTARRCFKTTAELIDFCKRVVEADDDCLRAFDY